MNTQILKTLVAVANTDKSSFVSFVYENDHAVTRYIVRLGTSLRGTYERGLKMLEAHRELYVNDAVQLQAIDELIASCKNSLDKGIGNNDSYTKKDVYDYLAPNLKVHKETGKIYLFGFVAKKFVLKNKEPYKTVNSSAKTLAKKALRERYTKLDKFREFVLDEKHFGSMSIQGDRILINSNLIEA
jgi:hypothetical protein